MAAPKRAIPVQITDAVRRALLWQGHRLRRPAAKPQTKTPVANQAKRITKSGEAGKPFEDRPDEEKLIEVTSSSHEILFKANAVWPFQLFRDTVSLDREKLSLVHRHFFFVSQMISIPVRDILSVEANLGPFFGSIKVSSRYFISNPQSIDFLWRKQAEQLRRLLQGYIIVFEREIDCTNINKQDLIKLLNELGKSDVSLNKPNRTPKQI